MNSPADLIFHNGRITTLDPKYPEATNIAVKDGRIVGVDEAEEYERGPDTEVIDLKGRRCIADAEGTSAAHTARPVGARGWRMDRISICRAAHADARRNQCCCARNS